MEHRLLLRGDCSACQGLCCVSLGFEHSEWFAFDKAAGTACPLLEPGNACRVHAELEAAGFAGCKSYDCYGAGQRTCQMYGGRSWRDGAGAARAMFETFLRLRQLHELRWLLHEAGRLPLQPAHARARVQLLAELEAESTSSLEGVTALQLDELDLRTRCFLRELRRYLPELPPRRRLPTLRG